MPDKTFEVTFLFREAIVSTTLRAPLADMAISAAHEALFADPNFTPGMYGWLDDTQVKEVV